MRKPERGQCYRDSFDALLVLGDPWTLVHGYPRLTRRDGPHPEGSLFGHAWLECEQRIGDTCSLLVCRDSFTGQVIPAVVYYAVGRIDPDLCSRYSLAEAIEASNADQSYGPWGEVPARAVFRKEKRCSKS